MDRAQLLARAEALVPILARRSADAEKARRCPQQTVADFVATGLTRVCQPRQFGGFELGYDVLCEITQTLARGCGSQAWVYMVLADNPLKLSAFTLSAQHDVWGETSTSKVCVAIAAVGRARAVDGGVTWNGQHGFCSGIDHADWVICGGNMVDDESSPGGCFALIPTRDIRINDDWDAIGLTGSGSNSFAVEDVFVPAHRVLDKAAYDGGTAPGTLCHDTPIARLPRGGVSAVSYTAVAVGVAEGFLANYARLTATRRSRGQPVAGQPGIQIGLGQASAEIEAAGRVYLGAIRACMQTLERREPVSREQNLRGKRDACYAAQLAIGAVSRLFNAAGGTALFADNVLQRQFRDCYAAAAHHSLVWDTAAQAYGAALLARHQPGS